jgi:predicted RND superfamily exporter protein
LVLVLLLPLLGWSAYKALASTNINILEWMPRASVEVSNLVWFDEHFGTDQILVISWQGAEIGDPRVDAVTKSIRKLKTPQGEELFASVLSGSQAMRYITGYLRINRTDALARLNGWLVGSNESTAVVAVISGAGEENIATTLERVRIDAASIVGLPAEDIRIAGTTADRVAVEAASNLGKTELGAAAVSIALIVAVIAMGGLLQALPILICALTSSLASLAAMYVLAQPVDGLTVIVPVLAFVLTASATLHLDGYREGNGKATDVMVKALMNGSWPTAVALVTTFIGFSSLIISEVIPIQRFAIASSFTVIIVALVCSLVWPALTLSLRSPSRTVVHDSPIGKWPMQLEPRRNLVFMVVALLMLVSIAGLPRLDSSFGIDRLLRANHALVEDYQWFEANVGNAVPVEIVVRFKNGGLEPTTTFLERARIIADARTAISALPGVGGAFAADTFLPTNEMMLEGVSGQRLKLRLNGFQRKIEELDLLAHTKTDELWRISARVSAFGGLDFKVLDESLGGTVRSVVAQYPDVAEVKVLGGLPMIARAQQQLLHDLMLSFGIALAALSAGFALMLRSVRTGLLVVIPNVLPVAFVFGLIGWLQSPVDIGLVMTASAAIGLAVDDSAHLLIAFKRAIQKGQTATTAAEIARQQIAPSAIRSSLICGVPMAIFAFSTFLPAARFGVVMALIIAVAIIVDLFLFPLLLASFGARSSVAVDRESV